ncbi:hypothetical protein KH5H1_01240 [Corallococcus caeni]|nr:hypothetical protein KH5H1_01240 [Corallococcus sp. KH5-1]
MLRTEPVRVLLHVQRQTQRLGTPERDEQHRGEAGKGVGAREHQWVPAGLLSPPGSVKAGRGIPLSDGYV